MPQEQNYTLFFKELSDAKEIFEYSIKNDFLSKFDEKEILSADVLVLVGVEKKSSDINLEIELKGSIDVVCNRCLDAVSMPVAAKDSYLIKLDNLDENDDSFEFDEKNCTLNMQPIIYELIKFQIPIQIMHEEGQCNAEMMKILSKYLIDSEKKKDYQSDSRWDALKNINLT